MRSGELSMVVEIPPGFGRDVERLGADARAASRRRGSKPVRSASGSTAPCRSAPRRSGATCRACTSSGSRDGPAPPRPAQQLGVGQRQLVLPANIELRYRYNPDVKSLLAMVPAVIPLLLLLIPAMLATLSVVREKDLGSIINFYVTPTTRLEFLLGKQLPYVVLGFLNFLLLMALAVTLFGVPLKGRFRDRGRRRAALRRLLHRDRAARSRP